MAFLFLALLLTATGSLHSKSELPKGPAQLKSDFYLDQLRRRVEAVWRYPNHSENLQATVKFNLDRAGYISDLLITKSSGRDDFDLSVLQAIKTASPFPPIPEHLMQNTELRKVEMTFSRKFQEPELLKKQKPKSPAPRRPTKQTPGVQI
jgi:TonB family protein